MWKQMGCDSNLNSICISIISVCWCEVKLCWLIPLQLQANVVSKNIPNIRVHANDTDVVKIQLQLFEKSNTQKTNSASQAKTKLSSILLLLCQRSISCVNAASLWHVRRGCSVWSKLRSMFKYKEQMKNKGKGHGNLFRSRRINGETAGNRDARRATKPWGEAGEMFKAVTVDKDRRCAWLMFATAITNGGKTRIRASWFATLLFFLFFWRRRDIRTLAPRRTIFHGQQEINWRRRSGAFGVSGINLCGRAAVKLSV